MFDRMAIEKLFNRNCTEMNSIIENGIERFRKGFCNISIIDKNNNMVNNVVVHIEQVSHDFKFGANCFMLKQFASDDKNIKYEQMFKKLFNMATVPFYWRDLEPVQGKPRYSVLSEKVYRRPPPDLCIEWCRKNGITPKAHCVVYEGWRPDWVPDDLYETKRLYEKRFKELSEHYKDDIFGWEIINETLLPCHTIFTRQPDYIDWSFNRADNYFKNNELIINEAQDVLFENVDIVRNSYYMLLQLLKLRNVRYDAIGLQYHVFCRQNEYENHCNNLYDLKFLYEYYTLLSSLGKKLQVTEITIPAFTKNIEDEQLQADILSRLYELWFSVENMEAIVYWNLVDGYAAFAPEGSEEGENYFHGGLVNYDFTEKPAYKALDNLINDKWHTEKTFEITDGNVQFRGFYGNYKVTVSKQDGEKIEKEIHLRKGYNNNFSIQI